MKSLYINTTEKLLSIAFKNGSEFDKFISSGEKTQNEEIFNVLENILNGNKISDLDFIVILTGPGSFTGIRLGISIVKGFMMSTNIPVIPINNFNAVYYTIKNQVKDDFLITIDAGGNDLFSVEMNKDGNNLSEPQIIKKDDLKNDIQIFSDVKINIEKVLYEIEKNFNKENFKQSTIDATYVKPHYAKVKKV